MIGSSGLHKEPNPASNPLLDSAIKSKDSKEEEKMQASSSNTIVESKLNNDA